MMTWLLVGATAAFAAEEQWVQPKGLPLDHNGGHTERLTAPAAGKQPHILMILFDDYGCGRDLITTSPKQLLEA